MSFLAYRRLERDLYWGYQLLLMRDRYAATGFRGSAGGKGFRAYLASKDIPPRQAYRLIKRYMRFAGIWARVHVTNEKHEPDQKLPTWLTGHLIMAGVIRDSISDSDNVTNAQEKE